MNETPSNPISRPRQGMDYGEQPEVQEVHAAIQREKREPRVGLEPLSIWLIAVFGFALFTGGAYLGRYSSGGLDYYNPGSPIRLPGQEGPQAGGELSPAERGKKVYAANCVTCHQANGQGSAGQYPPLAGSEFVIEGSKRPAMIVLKGLQGPLKVKGQQYGSAVMQPWDKTLNDQKIADVLTYIRQEWGNTAGPVAAEGIAALRKELAGKADSFVESDVLAVPADANVAGGEGAAAPGEAKAAASPAAPAPAKP